MSVGDTVRVRMGRGLGVSAAFRRWDGSSMVLEVEGLPGPWRVSVFDMSTLEVYTDRTRREGFRHGALLGGVSGIFIGAALAVALNGLGVTDDPDGPSDQIITQGIRGAMLGFVGGAISYGIYRGQNPGRGWIGLALPAH